jgi:superfamily II DNA/RNA helicase
MEINKLLVEKKFATFDLNETRTEKHKALKSNVNLNVNKHMLESYLNNNDNNDRPVKKVDHNNNEEIKVSKPQSKFSKIMSEMKNQSRNSAINEDPNQYEINIRQNNVESVQTQINTTNQIESIIKSQSYEPPNRDIISDGFKDLKPIRKYDENNFHTIVIDFIKKSNQIQISELQSYCLASIINGRHLLAMTNQNTNTPRTYIYPLISMMLKEKERLENLSVKVETGFIKNSISRAQNGPVLLIICSSCKDAQRIFEIITDLLELIARYKQILAKSRQKYTNVNDNLRALLIDGGGHDHKYDVPLANGCDILISSTPFSILRVIGNYKTNLERLKYIVFDEAHILVEKFPRQIKTLIAHYSNLLNVNDNQAIAQLIAFTSQWSPKLRKLVDDYFYDPVILADNRLESSYFGQTHHVLKECTSLKDKISHLISFIQDINIYRNNFEEDEDILKKIKNTVIFVNDRETGFNLYAQLNKANIFNVNLIHEYTQHKDIEKVEKLWNQYNLNFIKKLTINRNSKKININLILIIQDSMLKYINIDCAKLVINFDLPSTKTVFSDRLWLMRRHFSTRKEIYDENSNNKTMMPKSSTLEDIKSNNYYTKEAQNQIIDHEIILNTSNGDQNNDEMSLIENELVSNDDMRLCSVILFTLNDNDKSTVGSILNYLKRIGFNESKLCKSFVDIANKQVLDLEKEKFYKKLCPYVKAFGKCLEISRRKCQYRHVPNNKSDQMGYLNNDFRIPHEGYVRFKISYVEDSNYFFINILGYQNLRKETVNIDSNIFTQFDMELQAFFSNTENIEYSSSLKENEMYVFKDISTSIYKRVVVTHISKRDKLVVYEVIVQAVDYGAKYSISTTDLIIIPDKFRKLPPQAVEVYLCNIRPIDCDLNWSSYSKLYIAEKLIKTKEFVGKIQMAAGRSLWLDPISSFNHLKDISLVVINDSIRLDLISNNYGVKYDKHIEELRNLFIKNAVPVPRLEDETFLFEKECLKLYNYLYNLSVDEDNIHIVEVNNLISYSFLDQTHINEVQVSAVDTPSRFYIQKAYSHDLLRKLNEEFEDYLAKINDLKAKLPIQLIKYEDDERNEIKFQLDFIERTNYFRKHFNLKSFDYLKSVSKSMFCFACLKKENNQHFRAEILDVYENQDDISLKVFFVDYGDYETVCMEDIYPIEEKYLKMLPFQAIECRLDNLRPIVKKQEQNSSLSSLSSSVTGDLCRIWSLEASDMLWSLTHTENNSYLIMDAYVNEEINNTNSCEYYSKSIRCYSICLKIKYYPVDLDVSYLMVASQEARFSKDELNRLFMIDLDKYNMDQANDFKNDARKFVEFFFRYLFIN